MRQKRGIAILFYIAAFYDGILGMAFLFCPFTIFNWLNVAPPNHPGYIHFPAALLIVFAVMFINISLSPIRNRNLIPYGILLKAAYCSVVFWHWFAGGLPDIWKLFAIFDVFFGVLFLWAYNILKKQNN